MRLRSELYEAGLFRTRKLPCVVISIGNLTLGGSGKTPATMWLAAYIQSQGKKVAIVSRGYKAKNNKPVSIVSDGQRILLCPDDAGDEPFMMAKNLPGVPLLIGKKRFLVGMRAIEDFQAGVVLLDDGYQHLPLARDLNLLLLRAVKSFGNDRMFPAGILREPLSGLKRADAFILTYAEEDTGSTVEKLRLFLRKEFPDRPIFISSCKPVSFYLLNETSIRLGRTKDNENPPSPPFSKGGDTLSPPLGKDEGPSVPPLKKGGDQSIPPLEKGDTGGFSDDLLSPTPSSPPIKGGEALLVSPLPLWERARVRGEKVFPGEKVPYNLSELKGKKALAFCGIAHPESFRKMLIRLGVDLVGFMAYRDHYDYHGSDLQKIEENATRKGADCIITTEKDAVKIGKLPKSSIPIGVLKTEFTFERSFESFISERIGI